jgi:hypothetical protein
MESGREEFVIDMAVRGNNAATMEQFAAHSRWY